MVSATVLDGSAGIGFLHGATAGAQTGGVDGAWSEAIPSWARRVVALRAGDEAARMRAPGVARLVVGAALVDWGLWGEVCPAADDGTSLYDTVAECVSEIVTNAGEHVRWDLVPRSERGIGLALLRLAGRLVVQVTDPEPVRRRRVVSASDVGSGAMTRGRGLWLVDAYVVLWGGSHAVEDLPDGGGKAAWFWLPVGAGPP